MTWSQGGGFLHLVDSPKGPGLVCVEPQSRVSSVIVPYGSCRVGVRQNSCAHNPGRTSPTQEVSSLVGGQVLSASDVPSIIYDTRVLLERSSTVLLFPFFPSPTSSLMTVGG